MPTLELERPIEAPMVEVVTSPVLAESANNEAAAPPEGLVDQTSPLPEITQNIEQSRLARLRTVGRTAMIRAGVELIGIGVDAMLIGAGNAGVSLMRDVALREITATAPEIALLDRVLPSHGGHSNGGAEKTRAQKVRSKATGMAVGVGTAVLAQKTGIHVADHIHSGLNHGAGEFAVPIASKFGALVGLSSARRRLSRR